MSTRPTRLELRNGSRRTHLPQGSVQSARGSHHSALPLPPSSRQGPSLRSRQRAPAFKKKNARLFSLFFLVGATYTLSVCHSQSASSSRKGTFAQARPRFLPLLPGGRLLLTWLRRLGAGRGSRSREIVRIPGSPEPTTGPREPQTSY